MFLSRGILCLSFPAFLSAKETYEWAVFLLTTAVAFVLL